MNEKPVSRRTFSKQTLLAGIWGLSAMSSAAKKKVPVGLQLYTLRDLMKDDFVGTLTKVAKIGYPAVEFAGYGNLSGAEVRKLLNDLGLECCGTHEGFDVLTAAKIDQTIEFNQAIGNPFIICPSMPGAFRDKGSEGIKAFAEAMNEAGAKINKAGMQLCYHNHDFEFKPLDGKTILDWLLERTDGRLVQIELDTYWASYAGVDPIALIKKLSGRCPLLHMKDMSKTEPRTFAPVGMGIMNIKGMVKAGQESGSRWFVVEQDRCQGPALEAVSFSFAHLRKLLS